jgi:hypothetical protein
MFAFEEDRTVIKLSRRALALTPLLAVGCGGTRETPRVDQSTSGSDSVATVDTGRIAPGPVTSAPSVVEAPLPPPRLTCAPTNFGPDDTLTLRMNVPHGHYLIATQPGDSLFYIIYPQLNMPTRKYSLIPPEEFKQTDSLKLPWNVKAIPWYAGRDTTLAPLFPRPGRYVLTVGENLEGDNPHGASCTVIFTEGSRR